MTDWTDEDFFGGVFLGTTGSDRFLSAGAELSSRKVRNFLSVLLNSLRVKISWIPTMTTRRVVTVRIIDNKNWVVSILKFAFPDLFSNQLVCLQEFVVRSPGVYPPIEETAG